MTLRELGIVSPESREDGMRQAQSIIQSKSGECRVSTGRALLMSAVMVGAAILGLADGYWIMSVLVLAIGIPAVIMTTKEVLRYDGFTGELSYTRMNKKMQFQLTDITDVDEHTEVHKTRSRGRTTSQTCIDYLRIHVGGEIIRLPLRRYHYMKNEMSFNSGYTNIEDVYQIMMLYKYYFLGGIGATSEQQLRAEQAKYVRQTQTAVYPSAAGQNRLPASHAAMPQQTGSVYEPDPMRAKPQNHDEMPEI